MEAKKKDEITVGSVVQVVSVTEPLEERLLGTVGMVVSVVKTAGIGFCSDYIGQAMVKVIIDGEYYWFKEYQVQLVIKEKPEGTAHKFKVGDMVRVTNNPPAHLSRSSDDVLWISKMNRYCGHLHRITDVCERGYILNGSWDVLFSEEWLEPASPDKPKPSPKRTIVIEITDDGANAKYVSGKEVKKTASIKRHPDDKPDDEVAASLAIAKLFGRNLRDLENAADESIKLHNEAYKWICGAGEALGEAEKRIRKLI